MSGFVQFCNTLTPLTKEASEQFSTLIKHKTFKKGQIINKEGQICKHFFFIEKGLVKHYYHHKSRVFILRFFAENNVFTVLESYLNRTPSKFTTVALEDTVVSYLTYDDLEKLCRNYHCIDTLLKNIFLTSAVLNLKRTKELFDDDATELYKSFVKENPHLVQRISLGDTASYLGISQVTLSRIRAKFIF